ncbi:amino acid--tRNA ligase-related protein, partial [Vibrio cholerae]|uniref:amino acid--tRNA ligase-related protein n=1 Tax=Vibrio cholerae TaxID=666 RepID=UPI0018F0791F
YATYEDMMDLGEGLIMAIIERVLSERKEELKTLERDISKLESIARPFPRLHYDEAVSMLQEGYEKGELENRFEWGGDFGS